MKKILFVVLTLCLSSLFAELYPARRYVELGVGVDVLAAQNAMPLADIFKKNLVLDLKSISSSLPKSGFRAYLWEADDVHLDFNFKKFGFGFHANTEYSANLNISKELFDILGSGIRPGEEYTAEGNVWAESFVSFSVPVRFNVGKWRVKVAPACFAPIFYAPSTTVKARAVNGNDGSVTISASAPIEFYTVGKYKDIVKNGTISTDFLKDFDTKNIGQDLARAMGFDISALVEYPLFDTLDVGGYANIPIVPARLKGKVSATATLSAQCDSIMRVITDDSKFEKTAEITDAVYSDANYAVNRPMRLGAECAWRPVGKWLTLRGSAGLALRNPFGEDFSVKSVYPEYKLGVEIVGIGMFGLNLSTEYTKKIFAHSVGIMLNFRAIEFDIAAAVCSPTFIQSFKGEGLCASAAVKLGW